MLIQILSQKAVAELIAGIGSDAKTVQANIHVAAVSTLDHAREHGDFRGCLALLNALPNGQRVKALNAWYQGFSNKKLQFKLNKDSKEWEGSISKERAESDFNVTGAMAVSFADYTQEREPGTFTLLKLVKSLESKANNTETNTDGSAKVADDARVAAAKVIAFLRESGLDPRMPAVKNSAAA